MSVIDFYDRHPISEARVLAAAARRRGTAGGRLVPRDLFDFDQDHYGGLAAVETLARRAGIGPASRVLDVCAGLGGPARFLAERLGCRVVALELHAGRAAGAARLTRLVGPVRVAVVQADATVLPLGAGRFDACLSQEGFLHIEDKARVLRECRRVLAPGGRLAFTDWIATPRLGGRERDRLRAWMAATSLQTLEGYRAMLGHNGFQAVTAEDVSDEWRPILRQRREMYRALRDDAVARFGERWYRDYREIDTFFVGLVEAGKLGGGRFSGTA